MNKYIYQFDIAAILLTVMLIVIVLARKTYPTKPYKIFKVMLWFNLVTAITDLITSFMISQPQMYNLTLNYFVNIIYLMFQNLTAIIFLIYIIVLIRGNYGKKGEKIFWMGAIVFDVLLIITTPLTKWVVYFDRNLNYCSGPMLYALYAIVAVVLFYSFYLFIKYRSQLSGFQMATNVVFLTMLAGAVILQFFFRNLLVQPFAAGVAFMMMNLSLDNPSIYLYRNTSCYNQNAFNSTLDRMLDRKVNFSILAFTFNDIYTIRKNYSDALRSKVIMRVIEVGQKLFGQKRFYVLSRDMFAVDLGEEDVNEAITKLTQEGTTKFRFDEEKINFSLHYCIVRNSSFTNTVSEINESINVMLFSVYKKTGERLVFDNSKVLESHRREALIIRILREAIQNDGFVVNYQPIYDRESKTFVSIEALVRLKNTEFGYIGPDEFIPIAERNGLILDIGETVLEKVCRFWRDTNVKKLGIKWVEVNLSMMQLIDSLDADRLVEICNRYNMSPKNVNFEITETVGANGEESNVVSKNIEKLQAKGFNFSLDDYGSGYSNATYFAGIPFKIIKIDKTILWNAMKDERFYLVLNNILWIVKKTGRKCVCEGVETQEMIDKLTELECDYFQGYFYSKPLPEQDILKFLQENNKTK